MFERVLVEIRRWLSILRRHLGSSDKSSHHGAVELYFTAPEKELVS